MDIDQKQELTSLRDAFRRNRSQLELSVIESYMADYLHDRSLRIELGNDVVARAVWYCLCNNNADRDLLISKLYDYFTKKQMSDGQSLRMISIVLFLGGVDFQMNPIARPGRSGQSPSSWNSLDNTGHNVRPTRMHTSSPNPKRRVKWIAGLAVLAVVVPIVVMVSKGGGGNVGGGGNSQFSKMDLCRTYNGYIEDGSRQQSIMKVTYSNEIYHVTVCPVSNQSNKNEYDATVNKDLLKLAGGPNLTIEKTKKRTKLHCEAGRGHGKWHFESQ